MVKLLPPSLTRPPVSPATPRLPLKLLSARPRCVSVKAPRVTVPAPAREPKLSTPPKVRPVPAFTVTAGAAVKRLASPKVSVPPFTVTVVAALVALSVLSALMVRSPPPSGVLKRPPLSV